MLIEIILAFVIAMGITYFMFELVIKIKNKNDDLLVKTLVSTEQAIIMNQLMKLAMSEEEDFNCELLTKRENVIYYDDNIIDIVSDYAFVGAFKENEYCFNSGTSISIDIPLEVVQLPDDNFDVKFEHKYVSSYAVYYDLNKTLAFYKDLNEPEEGQLHNGMRVTKVFKDFEKEIYAGSSDVPWDAYRSKITSIVIDDKISPISTAYWFYGMGKISYFDVSNIDTSSVINMSYMFYNVGSDSSVSEFKIIGFDKWDTSEVQNMSNMFNSAGYYADSIEFDVSNWDVSKVTNMKRMFSATGRFSSKEWKVGDLSKWDTSSVTDMSYMFYNASGGAGGAEGASVNVSDLQLGVDEFSLGDLSNWNVSKVTNMEHMFNSAGRVAGSFYIGDLSGWNPLKVTNMERMFSGAGRLSGKFQLKLDNWNVSSVKNMSGMFAVAAEKATEWDIGNLSKWNVSNVEEMKNMFYAAGYNATSLFNLSGLPSWKDKLKKVKYMDKMFYQTGSRVSFEINLSEWDVSNVESYQDFAFGVESKIIVPIWVE